MSIKKSQFSNIDDWRDAAMRCSSDISEAELSRRLAIADAYNRQQDISDPDILADQQLYIQGKMDLEEYQDYLLFKHSAKAKQNESSTE
jgi:hypothetical protein